MSPSSAPQSSRELSRHQHYEFARVMHWVGVAILTYFLIDLIFLAWPVALLQPAWLDKMIGFFVGRGITPLTGALLVAGASVLNPFSTRLANRAIMLRRMASWVATAYLLLIPVQIYSGVRLLQARKQESSQIIAQATRSVAAIKQATTPAELRRAYEQIPGQKAPLPAEFPQPFPVIKERLAEALSATTQRAEYEFSDSMSTLWQRSFTLALGNIMRIGIFFLGFAAIGRRSPDHPSFLESLLSRSQAIFGHSRRPARHHDEAGLSREWLDMEGEQGQGKKSE